MKKLLSQVRTISYWCVNTLWWIAAARSVAPTVGHGRSEDRGSIGEWVMILVMAVGIVLFIWSIAQPMLGQILRNALSKLFQ